MRKNLFALGLAALVAGLCLGMPAAAQSAEVHRSPSYTQGVEAKATVAAVQTAPAVTQRGAFALTVFAAGSCDAKAPPFTPGKAPPGSKGGGKKKCATLTQAPATAPWRTPMQT